MDRAAIPLDQYLSASPNDTLTWTPLDAPSDQGRVADPQGLVHTLDREWRNHLVDTEWHHKRSVEEGSRQCPSQADEPRPEAEITLVSNSDDTVAIVHADIAVRSRHDLRLRLLGEAMEGSSDAVVLIDAASMALVDANAAACQMFDHSRATLLAAAPEALFSTTRHELETSWQALIAGDVRGDTVETSLQGADGTQVVIEMRRRAVRIGTSWLIVKVARDITVRKTVERTLQRQAAQHALLARFGHFALENPPLHDLMSQAVEIVQEGLNVELCRLLEVGIDDRTLELVAGVGWDESWLRDPFFDAVVETEDRFILGARESVVVSDFESEMRFKASAILLAHGVRSAVEVLICGCGGSYGIVGAYSRERGRFGAESANFVQSVSNTLAAAIERKKAEDRLIYMAQYDELTGLATRGMYLERLGFTLIEAERTKRQVAVLFIDIDRFKNVNDTYGHAVGDMLLVQIAERLRLAMRPGDTVARLSGDEFAIALTHFGRVDDAAAVTQRLVDTLAAPFRLGTYEVYVSASIGIGVYPIDGSEPDILLKNADIAMYRAKESGRNSYQFYMAQMNERTVARMRIESQLRGALDRGEYLLHYQPKVSLATGEICGMEALLRWQPMEGSLVSPDAFIPILEDTGLIIPVGEWVVATVCTQIARWRVEGMTPRPVAVNLSARQFRQKNLADVIGGHLTSSGVEPGLLELELTESCLMNDADAAVEALHQMKALGIRISIDDFGTGYSSLAYLRRFPLDTLKIDRAFIRNVTTDANDATIARVIINLARSLKLKVVAEGVETEEQLNFLRAEACDEIQGYYFSRPVLVDEITRMMREGRRLIVPSFVPAPQ